MTTLSSQILSSLISHKDITVNEIIKRKISGSTKKSKVTNNSQASKYFQLQELHVIFMHACVDLVLSIKIP